ncbi:MAG: ComF family protein, partial [Thermodesulfovibrionales bacterium]|nr:ComF family protein [Thermodesulfovibrionales bacterium]
MINFILNQLFPEICPICKKPSDLAKTNPICSHCWHNITYYDGARCKICGKPTDSAEAETCSDCIVNRPYYNQTFYYGLYDGALKEALHLLKYQSIKRLSDCLSDLMIGILNQIEADILIPIPLHKKRLLHREFNQSAVIGYKIAKKLHLKFDGCGLSRVVHNPPQSLMKGKERIRNVKDIFKLNIDVKEMSIILFDDIITTGATIN